MLSIPCYSVCYTDFQQVSSAYMQFESSLFPRLGQCSGGWRQRASHKSHVLSDTFQGHPRMV